MSWKGTSPLGRDGSRSQVSFGSSGQPVTSTIYWDRFILLSWLGRQIKDPEQT